MLIHQGPLEYYKDSFNQTAARAALKYTRRLPPYGELVHLFLQEPNPISRELEVFEVGDGDSHMQIAQTLDQSMVWVIILEKGEICVFLLVY